MSLLSSGNPNVCTSTPNLVINGDPVVWDDTKQLTLTQTLMYALTSKLDVLTSFSGSYKRSEYMDYFTLEPKSESKTQFDSVWLGLNYRGDRIGELVPMLTLQAALYQRENALRQSKNFSFKSYSIKGSCIYLYRHKDRQPMSINF
ncbi:nucleoid-structuring protein H-NS [Campylobacter concisus]|uniref:nucleoid-structuring protein H-NS n=1 Tax=Campylobacter concisus TaxID=199 RepID=UPI00214D63D9|nr:nucleoid-structuring protein H-NS [Campylobacter concisus]